MSKTRFSQKRLLTAIEGSAGIISVIAQKLDCSWNTAKRYIMSDPVVRSAWDDERQKVLDLAEQTVIKAMRDGDAGTARWVLATLGKDRGYVERREVTGADGGAIEVKTDALTDEQRIERIMAIIDAARARGAPGADDAQ